MNKPSTPSDNLPPIDPTKNVLDLVQALKEMLAELRTADTRYQDSMREAEAKYQTGMRVADRKRRDDLADQKRHSDERIAEMLRSQAQSDSVLLSTQLDRGMTAITDRVSKLEQFRWEMGGKTSVTDPALA